MSKDAHEIRSDLRRVAAELGRTPTHAEYLRMGKFSERQVKKHFGGFVVALQAAGLEIDTRKGKRRQAPQEFRYEPQKIHGFYLHNLDLAAMFKRAGNPPVLKMVAQPDTHMKYRDIPATECFLKFLEFYQPDVDLIGGDFLDAEGLSPWPSDDMGPRRFVPEVIEAREWLGRKVAATRKATTRIYLEGNHEDWINQFLASGTAPQLHDGLEELGLEINLKKLLDLDGFGYQLFPVNHIVRVGKINLTHGLYTGGAHAKKHLDVLKGNIFYFHVHDEQAVVATSLDGPTEAHSLGCLCRLDAKFLKGKPNNWVHAFGIWEIFPDGSYTFMCPKIINGRMAYNGRVFQG